jgi:hydrogenase-1 operon protein HyaE
MTMALIDKLVESHGYPTVDAGNVDEFIAAHPTAVLFFYGDPKQYPESNDVAIILPELVREFSGHLAAAIVAREAQPPLQQRYGFTQWPALVFVRRDGYLGAITRVQDWADYLEQVARILVAAPSRPPLAVSVVGGEGACMNAAREQGG